MKKLRSALFIMICLLTAVSRADASEVSQAAFRIVALGDSLTAGQGVKPEESFPAQLDLILKKRGYNAVVINAGVSGDTTAGGLSRLDWVIKENPDLVIVELGANDVLRAFDPEETRRNLDEILRILSEKHISVLLTGMKAPPNLGPEYAQAFESIYPDLAQKHNTALMPFFLEGVAAEERLNQGDGLHPTAEGVLMIIKNMLPVLEPLIKK